MRSQPTTMTKIQTPGLSISAGVPCGLVTTYQVALLRAGIEPERVAYTGASNAAATHWAVAWAAERGVAVGWLLGGGVDRKVARKLKLRVYERMPGGGRSRKPEGETVVALNTWVLPADLERIEEAAAAEGVSVGQVIARRFRD